MKFHFWKLHLEKIGYEVIIPDLFDFEKNFSLDETIRFVKKSLGKHDPDFIAGISFGGFILPHIARDYPKAKLIFIATGPFFKPGSKIFDLFLKISKFKISVNLGNALLKLPDKLVEFVYSHTYLFRGDGKAQEIYQKDMVRNLGYIKKIPIKKDIEILNFVNTVDNSKLLKGLKNESIIYCSKNDHFLPLTVWKKLHEFLINSKLITKDGEHFNVFEESDLKTVDEFLKK